MSTMRQEFFQELRGVTGNKTDTDLFSWSLCLNVEG
jgi:hypothetical protein